MGRAHLCKLEMKIMMHFNYILSSNFISIKNKCDLIEKWSTGFFSSTSITDKIINHVICQFDNTYDLTEAGTFEKSNISGYVSDEQSRKKNGNAKLISFIATISPSAKCSLSSSKVTNTFFTMNELGVTFSARKAYTEKCFFAGSASNPRLKQRTEDYRKQWRFIMPPSVMYTNNNK